MRGSRLMAALLVLALGLHGWIPPAAAARLTTAGWWWRAQTGVLAAPPLPHVPENGLAVGNAADGPTAVSALRFALEDDEADPVLSLVVAEKFAGSDVGLVACPSAAPWFGVQAGTWGERPEADCSASQVSGIESEDGGSWTFPLAAIYDDGLVDVVILPAEESGPFEMSFEPATSESLRTTPTSGSAEFDPGFAAGGAGDDNFFVPPSGFDGGVDFAPPPMGTVPSATEGAGSESEGSPSDTAPRPFVGIARPATPGGGEGDPRLLAVVILLAAVGAALMLAREPLPVPRLLGPLAARQREPAPEELETRGLGRFKRPRHGTAPSLH